MTHHTPILAAPALMREAKAAYDAALAELNPLNAKHTPRPSAPRRCPCGQPSRPDGRKCSSCMEAASAARHAPCACGKPYHRAKRCVSCYRRYLRGTDGTRVTARAEPSA